MMAMTSFILPPAFFPGGQFSKSRAIGTFGGFSRGYRSCSQTQRRFIVQLRNDACFLGNAGGNIMSACSNLI
jgi:hypothetical protein